MGDDIREIETQNRALQILNSNQHFLISELDGLLVILKIQYTIKEIIATYYVRNIDSYFYTP